MYLINSLMSYEEAWFALIIKFECIFEISAPPKRNPFKPSSSINFAAFKVQDYEKHYRRFGLYKVEFLIDGLGFHL